ncbi:MAG: glycosyltransferase [Chitinophagaceae bacterium]
MLNYFRLALKTRSSSSSLMALLKRVIYPQTIRPEKLISIFAAIDMTFTPSALGFYLFILVAVIQIFYYLFFFTRLAFFKKKSTGNQENDAGVSIIICARDEERNLTQNIPVVLSQQWDPSGPSYPFEVIVVNDNSADDTRHYLRALEVDFPYFRQIELKQEAQLILGKKFPLSLGIREASYPIILLTDADCRPSSNQWMQLMSEGFNPGIEIVLGYGPYLKKKGWLNKIIRFETYFSALQYLSYALAGLPYMGVGRNLAYKKELFIRKKGFIAHQHIASGDDDLFINSAANAQNTTIVIDPKTFTYSEPKITWTSWFEQKTRHFSTSKYYRIPHQILLGIFTFSQVLFYPLFILGLFHPELWTISWEIFGVRFLIQLVVSWTCMRKLHEKDLFPYFWLLDLLFGVYYMIFFPVLLLSPKRKWK